MKPVFQLMKTSLSSDTIKCLEILLDNAKQGQVLGIAYAAMLSNREFIVDATGECNRNPIFARGIIASLDDELSYRSRQNDHSVF